MTLEWVSWYRLFSGKEIIDWVCVYGILSSEQLSEHRKQCVCVKEREKELDNDTIYKQMFCWHSLYNLICACFGYCVLFFKTVNSSSKCRCLHAMECWSNHQ